MLVTKPQATDLASHLFVDREGIEWTSLDSGLVRISIAVQNRSLEASKPTTLRIESAPFGAFLPWQPLTTVAVPPVAPLRQVEVQVDVSRTPVQPLGDFTRVPADRLRTALGFEDPVSAYLQWIALRRRRPRLARDLMELQGHGLPYWVGNLNVHFCDSAVERHVARALRIRPGVPNHAQMMIGRGEYSFAVDAQPRELPVQVLLQQASLGLPVHRETGPCFTRRGWVRFPREEALAVVMEPSAYTTDARVHVRVTRREDLKEAVVEFCMEAAAQGPGCYTV